MAEAGHQSGTLPRNRLSADARDPEFQSAGRHVAAEGEENGETINDSVLDLSVTLSSDHPMFAKSAK
jgi:hypothetical protein